MVDGRQLKKAIDKFMQSPVCLDARVQIELPNGEMYDLTTMTLLENRLLGSSETHRLATFLLPSGDVLKAVLD